MASFDAIADSDASARPDTTADMGGEHRRLNGHNFLSPITLPSAFLNGSVGTQLGFGMLSFEGPDVLEGGTKTSRVFAYEQSLGGQIGILNRVAVEVYASGTAAVGGGLEEVLVLGALADVTAGGGVKTRVVSLEDVGFQLSLGTFVQYRRDLFIRPGDFLAAAADRLPSATTDEEVKQVLGEAASKLLAEQEVLEIAPAVMVAEGAGIFGAHFSFSPRLPVAGSADRSVGLRTGAQAELDFVGLSSYAPIAICAEYVADYAITPDRLTHQLSSGLFYSGRRDLSLGAVFAYAPGDITGMSGTLSLEYFF